MYSLRDLYKEYLSQTSDDFIHSLTHILDVYIELHKKQTLDLGRTEAYKTWERISLQKVWYHNDIYILTKIFYIFPPETAEKNIKNALKQFKKYDHFPHTYLFKAAFLINCSIHYIHSNRISMSKKHLNEAIKITEKHRLLDMKLTAEFLLCYPLYEEGKTVEATEKVYRIISMLTKLEKIVEKNDMLNDWKKYLLHKIVDDVLRGLPV